MPKSSSAKSRYVRSSNNALRPSKDCEHCRPVRETGRGIRQQPAQDQAPTLREAVVSNQHQAHARAARVIGRSKPNRLRGQRSALAMVFENLVVGENRGRARVKRLVERQLEAGELRPGATIEVNLADGDRLE